jgi:hypothetical protein
MFDNLENRDAAGASVDAKTQYPALMKFDFEEELDSKDGVRFTIKMLLKRDAPPRDDAEFFEAWILKMAKEPVFVDYFTVNRADAYNLGGVLGEIEKVVSSGAYDGSRAGIRSYSGDQDFAAFWETRRIKEDSGFAESLPHETNLDWRSLVINSELAKVRQG